MAPDLKSLFNDPKFVELYKTGEKATGIWATELVERAHFSEDLSKLDKLVVLDNACGSGIVSQKIMDLVDDSTAQKVDLTCADYAEAMVSVMKERIEKNSWQNARAVEADAQVRLASSPASRNQLINQDTKLPSSHFTHIFFSFGIMAIPDSQKCMEECHRILTPGASLQSQHGNQLAGMKTRSKRSPPTRNCLHCPLLKISSTDSARPNCAGVIRNLYEKISKRMGSPMSRSMQCQVVLL